MKRITIAVCTTLTGLILLFSWPTSTNKTATTTQPDATQDTTTGASPTTPTTEPAETTSPPAAAEPVAPATTSGTYDGATAQTEWGPVQVQIVVTDGAITSAEAIQFPDENPKDQQINAYALPILNSEVLDAQSASIDSVSGATVTSNGYVQSLQDALDQASM